MHNDAQLNRANLRHRIHHLLRSNRSRLISLARGRRLPTLARVNINNESTTRMDAQPHSGGIYRRCNPRASTLNKCVHRHGEELDAAGLIHRPVDAEMLEHFLDCGSLHRGLARIYCDQCGHDYLLAYCCKTRYFCPSGHQTRMLAYSEWLEDKRLAPVAHCQYVFALTKLVRLLFRYRRRYQR